MSLMQNYLCKFSNARIPTNVSVPLPKYPIDIYLSLKIIDLYVNESSLGNYVHLGALNAFPSVCVLIVV